MITSCLGLENPSTDPHPHSATAAQRHSLPCYRPAAALLVALPLSSSRSLAAGSHPLLPSLACARSSVPSSPTSTLHRPSSSSPRGGSAPMPSARRTLPSRGGAAMPCSTVRHGRPRARPRHFPHTGRPIANGPSSALLASPSAHGSLTRARARARARATPHTPPTPSQPAPSAGKRSSSPSSTPSPASASPSSTTSSPSRATAHSA